MYYEVHGNGFPLVMIAGLTENMDWWDEKLIKELWKKWTVILFDNRGVGRSSNDRDFTLKELAADTVSLMDSLHVEKAHVLGHSMGGMIAQELVLNHPKRVEKLILYSTSCGGSKYIPPSPEVLKMLMADTKGKIPHEIVKEHLSIMFTDEFRNKNPDFIETFINKVLIVRISYREYKRQMQAISGFNTARRLKTVAAPTLVIHGEKDVLSPPQNAINISQLIPEAQLELFKNSAHMIFEEEFDKALTSLERFLE